MKILHVYKSYYPETCGGIEECIHATCLGLIREGIECAVAVCANDPSLKDETLPYPVYQFKTSFSISSCPFSMEFIQAFRTLAEQFDLIHYYFPWPFADIMQLATQPNKPYLVTYQSDIVKQKLLKLLYTPLMHRFLSGAQCIIATSPAYIQSSPTLQTYRNKVVCIPIGTERSLYPAINSASLKKWKEQVGDQFILFIGVLRYYKGLDYLLKAAKHINAPIIIAGDGPEKKHLLALANHLKSDNVTFLGYVSEEDKVSLLTLSRILVAPAHLRSEAFCISLLEGLMFNKPLVSTELQTGTSFVNCHEKTGLVVSPGNASELGSAINRLLNEQDTYDNYRANTQTHYETQFTLKKMTGTILNCYQNSIL